RRVPKGQVVRQIFFAATCPSGADIMSHESCGDRRPSKRRVDPMTRAELIAIRRQLRAVNIETSGLARNNPGARRVVRRQELKTERPALVSLIVQNEKRGVRRVSAALMSEPVGLAAH